MHPKEKEQTAIGITGMKFDQPYVKFDQGLTMDSPSGPPVTPVITKGRKVRNLIKLALSHLTIPGLIVYLNKIVAKMKGNMVFTELAAKTTALETAVTALETANTNYNAALTTADQLMTVRDTAVITATTAAQALATGAEGISKDPATLESGGWELVSTHASPVGPMMAPANFCATSGDNEGSVDLACDTQKGVQAHIAEHSTSPEGPFTQFYVGRKSSCTKEGLPSGSAHWFRMCAVGAAGPGPYAGPITKRAT